MIVMAACKRGNAAPGARLGSGVSNVQGLAACVSENSAKIFDFQTKMPLEAYRLRWVRRRIPVSPELAAYFAAMAFSDTEGGR